MSDGWIVELICCGRADGTFGPVATWEQADQFRQSYIAAYGHERVGIIKRAPAPSGESGR